MNMRLKKKVLFLSLLLLLFLSSDISSFSSSKTYIVMRTQYHGTTKKKNFRSCRLTLLVATIGAALLWLFIFVLSITPATELTDSNSFTLTPQHNKYTAEMEARLPSLERPEQPVSMERFYQCMAQRLAVDMKTRTQYELVPGDTVPMMLFPFMMEVADLRALVCSMNTTIRYVVFVVNGGVPEVSAFFDDLEAVFGWTGRLTVHRNHENEGFSASVNTGIAAALSKPIEEVPFLFVSNIDVRYMVKGEDVLTYRVRRFHAALAKDAAKIAELEAEVAAEPSAHTPGGKRSLRGAWSPNATLVTSALLPDRVRYMEPAVRRQYFSAHTALCMVGFPRYTGSAFGMSRLAMLTVGYWDENFYPAYREDGDYFWRVNQVGFCTDHAPPGRANAIHYRHAMQKVQKENQIISPRAVQILAEYKAFVKDKDGYTYWKQKWGLSGFGVGVSQLRFTSPFSNSTANCLPMDAWIRDVNFREAVLLRNRALGALPRPVYKVSLVADVLRRQRGLLNI